MWLIKETKSNTTTTTTTVTTTDTTNTNNPPYHIGKIFLKKCYSFKQIFYYKIYKKTWF